MAGGEPQAPSLVVVWASRGTSLPPTRIASENSGCAFMNARIDDATTGEREFECSPLTEASVGAAAVHGSRRIRRDGPRRATDGLERGPPRTAGPGEAPLRLDLPRGRPQGGRQRPRCDLVTVGGRRPRATSGFGRGRRWRGEREALAGG